jgi:hypothetical protein
MRQRFQELEPDLGKLVHHRVEVAAANHQQPAVLGQDDCRRARSAIEKSDLAEEFTRTSDGEGTTSALDLRRAANQDEELLAGLALAHEHPTLGQIHFVGEHADPLDLASAETREEGNLPQQLELLVACHARSSWDDGRSIRDDGGREQMADVGSASASLSDQGR